MTTTVIIQAHLSTTKEVSVLILDDRKEVERSLFKTARRRNDTCMTNVKFASPNSTRRNG